MRFSSRSPRDALPLVNVDELVEIAHSSSRLAVVSDRVDLNIWAESLSAFGSQVFFCPSRVSDEVVTRLVEAANLEHLALIDQGIGAEGATAIAQHLTNLTTLNLDLNSIGAEGATAIAQHLTNLTTLNLDRNSIGDEGATAIAQHLTNLTTLNLWSNGLTTLRPFLAAIRDGLAVSTDRYSFDGLVVGENEIVEPPPEVVEQGSAAIIGYFDDLDEQGVDHLYEAKVLLVGQGGAGKTSLLTRLYYPDRDLPDEDETTQGIDVHPQEFRQAGGDMFRLNVWDFAGQEIYHATHQFFLTKRSLYVLVDDTRKDDADAHDPAFKYWLEAVKVLADSSPMLIFQNEKGGRPKDLAMGNIRGRFPNVLDRLGGDLADPAAADEIRAAIQYQVGRLDHVGDPVPAKWVDVRASLADRARQTSVISESQYLDIYAQHLEADESGARRLSEYLHDLGVFLHFQKNPLLRRIVVLRNEWATEAVFAVVNDPEVRSNFGRFTMADCERFWSDPDYVDRHPELLQLLEQFEFCHPLDETRSTWLAPQLLPAEATEELAEWAQPGDLSLRYQYDFLPRGIVSRLIVRKSAYLHDLADGWRSGALFRDGDTQVLVRTVDKGDGIELRARGSRRKELLSAIATDLDELNATYGNLRSGDHVRRQVPCICGECSNRVDGHLFDENTLRRKLGEQGTNSTAECQISWEQLAIVELLLGLELPRQEADSIRHTGGNNFYGDVYQTEIRADTVHKPAIGKRVESPAANTIAQPERTNRWPMLAGAVGIVSAILAGVLAVPLLGWRLGVVTAVVAGLIFGLVVLQYNPANFWRRQIGAWIGLGVVLNAISFAIDGVINRGDSTVDFTIGADLEWWWWAIWGVVLLALVGAELFTKWTERADGRTIDLRESFNSSQVVDLREEDSPRSTTNRPAQTE